MQVAERIKKHMGQRRGGDGGASGGGSGSSAGLVPRRLVPVEMEAAVKDWAANVEALVDKVGAGGRGVGGGGEAQWAGVNVC